VPRFFMTAAGKSGRLLTDVAESAAEIWLHVGNTFCVLDAV
jgi:hypothetical protein